MTGTGKRLHVVKTEQGDWGVRPEGARIIHRADTQAAAEDIGRGILESSRGGGQLITHRPNGQIRSADTINRKDPNPPRDTEH